MCVGVGVWVGILRCVYKGGGGGGGGGESGSYSSARMFTVGAARVNIEKRGPSTACDLVNL